MRPSEARGPRASLLALLAAAAACAAAPDRAPRPAAVEPARGDPAAATPVVIRGERFYVEATVSAPGAAGDTVDARYRAWLGEVELEQVRWGDGRTLTAVVPAGLSLGDHDLVVESAAGRRGALRAAFHVAIPAPDLSMAASLAPASATVGQPVSLVVTLTNAGDAAALGVLPVPAFSGSGGLALVRAPGPQDVLPGASATFDLAYRAAGAGTVSVAVDASGTDARSGGTATAPRADAGTVVIGAGATLSASATASTATASTGQAVDVTLLVANDGAALASAVTPAMAVSGPVALARAPPVRDVPPGKTRPFTWTYTATGAGAVTFTASASGTDANSGGPVSAQAPDVVIAVVAPAALGAALAASPATVSVGQGIAVALTVTNQGQAPALGVTPSAPASSGTASASPGTGPAPAPPLDLAAGASATFGWTLVASAPGSMALSSAAQGSDANSGAAVSAAATSATLQVQRPASLALAFTSAPARVSQGQAFQVSVTVSNAGEAAAQSVATSIAASAGPGAVAPGPAPAAADVAGGASAGFTRSFTATGLGAVTLSTSAAGSDANAGWPAAAGPATASLVVERPAALQATLDLPATIPLGEFTVTMTVTNTGDAPALAVAPGALAPAAGNTVAAALVSGPSGPLDVPGGGAQATFQWVYRVTAMGTVELQGSASGQDGNSGAAVATGTVASGAGTVGAAEAVKLADDPFGDGTSFAQVLAYGGKLVLAPSGDGRSVVRMNGDGSSPESLALAFAKDVNAAGVTSRNTWAGAPPYPSIGASGCAEDTAACGPDDEAGRAAWDAGVLGGTEWLLAAGARPASPSYVYLSSSSSAPLAFRYADLSISTTSQGRLLSSTLFDNDRVYLGVAGQWPMLLALKTAPAGSGLDATSADLIDLQLDTLPDVGVNKSLVDALTKFQGRLYVANRGGMVVATVDPPAGRADFVACTPSAAAWAVGTSIATAKFSDLTPADRAVPAFASWRGRLFAARNMTVGVAQAPQLWQCDPARSGDPARCDPGDWSLSGRDSAGSTSRMGDPSNGAVTLLAATPTWLYAGYDNASGIQIFRTAAARPDDGSDWKGLGGCRAGSPLTCRGLGGTGLGDPRNSRILDARVLTLGGTTALYVATGDGTGPVRVYRFVE